MALQDPLRSSVFHQFEALIGTDEAAAVMAQFPTYDIHEVVTLEQLDLRLRETESRMQTALVTEVARLDQRIADLSGEMNGRCAAQSDEMNRRFAQVDVQLAVINGRIDVLDSRIQALPAEMTRAFLVWTIPIMVSILGLCATALVLFR